MTIRSLLADKVICADEAWTVARWVAFEDGKIVAVGDEDPPGEVMRVDGTILPGLIDAHVHLTTTGLYDLGLDFRQARSVDDLLRDLRAHLARDRSEWLIGGNFDPGRNPDARMPTRHELDRVAPDRMLLVSRADGHSCALNSKALEALGIAPGEGAQLGDDGTLSGVLAGQANYETRRAFFGSLPASMIEGAQRRGCQIALSRGVTAMHEMAGGSYMGDKDFEVLMENRSDYPVNVEPYLSTTDIGKVVGAGLDRIGGDLFLDGSIGSMTAGMSEPYEGTQESGSLYRADEEIVAFFAESTAAGLQTGVHAIGDAAIEQALRCHEIARASLGPEAAVGALSLRHRIEHFECVSSDQLERAARLGLVASVQPAFDAYWGGPDGMYASRLGRRAAGMNPFSAMIANGLIVAGGSDSTVTPLDPFIGMAAAVDHQTDGLGTDRASALLMFSSWAARAGRQETERGSIEPGKVADLCLVPEDPITCSIERLATMPVWATWVGGRKSFEA